MFNKKNTRIAELEKQIESMRGWREDDKHARKSLEDQLHTAQNQVEYLIRTIRQTDDIIFSISQCTNWESMRPRVAQLTDQMTARKVAESNRITSLVTEELRKVYTDQTNAPKRIGRD